MARRSRANSSLCLPVRSAISAARVLAMGRSTDLGRSVDGAAAKFLGKPRAASRAGGRMGLQVASIVGSALESASPAMPRVVTKLENAMNKSILAAAALAAALSSAAPSSTASAATAAPLPMTAIQTAHPVQRTAVYCGLYGCGPIWPGPRRWEPRGPWGYAYRPACPLDYYYACRRGPLGDRQCACWPYRKW
jgi:hypothetical protein